MVEYPPDIPSLWQLHTARMTNRRMITMTRRMMINMFSEGPEIIFIILPS
jgi:hypothetical protein